MMIDVFLLDANEVVRRGLYSAFVETSDIVVVGELSDVTAADFVEQVVIKKPDVVLWNFGIDDQSAPQAKCIKELLPNSHILVFSHHGDDSQFFTALAAGVDGYLLHDSSLDQIKRAIRTVATGAGWLDLRTATRVLKSSGVAYFSGAKKTHSNDLSEREQQVLILMADGLSNQAMANHFCLSPETIKSHVRNIMTKLNVRSRTQAAALGVRRGLCA